MSPSPEELLSETGASAADAGFVVSDEVRAVADGVDAGSMLTADVRVFAAGADRGAISVPLAGISSAPDDGESADCAAGSDVTEVATGPLCAGSESARSVRAEDFSRAFVDVVCGSRLRNRRHVSELCPGAAALVATAGFAPNASLLSTSSCPVTVSPLRTW